MVDGLLFSMPNPKLEPFQTALSGSQLYCLSSGPPGTAIYGAGKREEKPAAWSTLFTDLACLTGMRERERRRWASVVKKYRYHYEDISVFTPHLPEISPQPILFCLNVTPLGFNWTQQKLLCRWLDRGHHCNVVGETEHASIQLHIYTNTLNRSTVNLKTGSYVHILSLFTLGTFSWGSTVIIWWYSAVIVRLAPAVGCEAPLLRMQTHGRWYLPGWWCLTSVMHKIFLILLLRWGRCFYQKRQAKKKTNNEGSGRSITPWHPVLSLHSVCKTPGSLSLLISWKQTSMKA